MPFDSSRYVIAPGEKAGAFILRVLRAEGALDADSAILRSQLKSLVAPVTFVHLVKSGALIEAAIGDEPAFYAAAAEDPAPVAAAAETATAAEPSTPAVTPNEEIPMSDAATESTAAAETPATTESAPAPVTIAREPIEIVKPAFPLTDVHPGITLQAVVLRAIHEAPRPVSVREVVDITGCARPSVAQAVNGAFKDGLLARTEGEDPLHYSTNGDRLADVFEIINGRATTHAVWLRICESPADAETIATSTGLSEGGVRSAVRSLLRNGWAFEDHKVGARKFYAGHATKQAPVEDAEEDGGETGSVAAEVVETAAAVATIVETAAPVVESAPAPAPAPAAAPLSIFEQLLQSDDGVAALRASFDANALLIAAITKVAKKSLLLAAAPAS